MSSKLPEIFCYMPWTSLALLPDGRISACCVSSSKGLELGDSKVGDTLLDVWKGEKLKVIRRQFLAGEWPASCVACKVRHEEGYISHKDYFFATLKRYDLVESVDLVGDDPPLLNLDLSFSNLCNLACRMCSSQYSTKWISIDQHLAQEGHEYRSTVDQELNGRESDLETVKSIEQSFGSLRFITVKGGEPLLAKNFIPFLQSLDKRGHSSNIDLTIVTNGTVAPNEELLSLLAKFKKVVLSISVDGVGRLFNYIRGGRGHDLTLVENSIQKYQTLNNAYLDIYPVVQAYNVFDIENIFDWSRRVKCHASFRALIKFPHCLQVGVLPKPLRQLAQEKLRSFLKKIENEEQNFNEIEHLIRVLDVSIEPKYFDQFLRYTRELDKYHQIHLEDIVPEFKGILTSNLT